MKKLKIGMLWWVMLALPAGALDMVRDGRAVSEIVVAADAHEGVKRAAEDLQFLVEQMSGAKLPIVNAPTAGVENRIHAGESEFTKALGYELPKFNNSGYDILVKGHDAVLAGPIVTSIHSPFSWTQEDRQYMDPVSKMEKPKDFPSLGLQKWWDYTGEAFGLENVENGGGGFNQKLKVWQNDDIGPWHAVSALLEQLGVRFYAPYEEGTIVPECKTIALPDQRVTKEAAFARRYLYYGDGPASGDPEGVAWLMRLKGGCHKPIIFNHTTYNIFANRLQHERHPEYLAEESPGKRFQGYPVGRGMPRLTDPGFRRACLVWLRKVLDTFPSLGGICMGVPDGGVILDYRDRPRYQKEGMSTRQAASDYLWEFNVYMARELQKSHPDRTFICFTHSSCDLFPTAPGEVSANVAFPYIESSAYRVQDAYDREVLALRKPFAEVVRERRLSKGPTWDYWLYYSGMKPRYPVFFWKSLQREMQEMRAYSDGKFMEHGPESQDSGLKGPLGGRIGSYPMMHLMLYIQFRLYWDPDLDVQALLDEYYRLYFGPAAAEMKAFHEFAHEVWNRQESRSVTETSGFLKEADVNTYFKLLAAAKDRAPADSAYFRRIEALEKGYAPLKKLFAGLKRTGPLFRAYQVPNDSPLDGDLSKYRHCPWYEMCDNATGEQVLKNRAEATINLTEDRCFLLVGVRCCENKMSALKADCTLRDDASIFEDDVIEVYVDSAERSYFKIVVNPNGAIWDETRDNTIIERDTLPILWNPGVQAVVKKHADRWEVEVKIPTADFGKLGPTKEYPWGILVGRTRIVDNGFANQKGYSITPTGGGYATLPKWGKLWAR